MRILVFLVLCVLYVTTSAQFCDENTQTAHGVAIANGHCGDICSNFAETCPGYRCICFLEHKDLCVVNVGRGRRVRSNSCEYEFMSENKAYETLGIKANSDLVPLWMWEAILGPEEETIAIGSEVAEDGTDVLDIKEGEDASWETGLPTVQQRKQSDAHT